MTNYKAFVCSTKIDLNEHRARVIEALRHAGILVDPMEDWTVDSSESKSLSVERMRDCYLDDTQISDVTPLAGLASLQLINLGATQISDVTPLAGLANLQSLNLGSTQISDITPLSGLANLQTLYLQVTEISDEELKNMQEALPKCQIMR